MSEWFPLIIFKTSYHKVFILRILIVYNSKMTPIDFGVTISKVTEVLNVKMVFAHYLRVHLS
jgi:hypothetical protein